MCPAGRDRKEVKEGRREGERQRGIFFPEKEKYSPWIEAPKPEQRVGLKEPRKNTLSRYLKTCTAILE
jgi:hypothetical protein